MYRLFGKPKAKEPSTPAPTLGQTKETMEKRISDMDAQIKGFDEELLRYKCQLSKLSGTSAQMVKSRALQTLKRKNLVLANRDQLMGQIMNVERTVFALETVKDSQVTMGALKEAAKQLKEEQKKINISELEDIQDDLADLLEDQEEIQEILGRSYGIPDSIDEADLDAELAGLEEELEGAVLDEPVSSISSPGLQAQQSTLLPTLGDLGEMPTVMNKQSSATVEANHALRV